MTNISMSKLKPYLTQRNFIIIAVFLSPILITFYVFLFEEKDEYVTTGITTYQHIPNVAKCSSENMTGESGASYGESTISGIKFNVRTPANYDSTFSHPLIMVYSPAGSNRSQMERKSNLTYAATKAGFIIAYADHPELSTTSTVELSTIPKLISKKWCIDQQRIFFTGHSDGGTTSMAIGFMSGTKRIPTAIAASAAGINLQSLEGHNCPAPISVMIMHSKNDRLFPNYGLESTGWWANCNNCDLIPEEKSGNCLVYNGCNNGVETWYCEGDKSHAIWPDLNNEIISFFSAIKKRTLTIKENNVTKQIN